MRKEKSVGILIVSIIIIALIGAAFWWTQKPQKSVTNLEGFENLQGLPQKITIAAIPLSFTGYSIYTALEKGYFRKEGLDANLEYYPHGKAAIEAVVQGEAEVGTSSETPFMHAVLDGKEIYAFATTITAQKHLAIVARKDRGISSINDLKGKRVGITIGSNGEYFLDTVLLLHGILRNEIETINLKPNQMVETLIEGKTDAVATWNPEMYRAREALGEQGITFYAEGIYAPLFLLIATKDYVHNHPEIIKKIVRAMFNTCCFIRNNPEESNKIAAKYMNVDTSLLNKLKASYIFDVSLEQSLVMTLEEQAKWAISHNLTHSKSIPNYLDYIYTDALEAVLPECMSILKDKE